MKKKCISLLLLLAVILAGCGGKTVNSIEQREKLTVVTSFYPVYLLAQAVTAGAEGMELCNMAQPQTGCLHDYELTIADMKLLEGADVLIINGGGMESFLTQAMERYPDLTVVDTSAGIPLLMEEYHHHGGEEAHDHDEEGNSHLWLSPLRAAEQAENLAAALSRLDAADAAVFAENSAAFRKGAKVLTTRAAEIGIPQGEPCEVFHEGFVYLAELFSMEPVCGVFADEYQIPSAKELAEVTEEARQHAISFFLAAEDSGKIYGETIAAEAGEQVLVLDALTTAAEGDPSYLERMERNIEIVEKHWKEAGK